MKALLRRYRWIITLAVVLTGCVAAYRPIKLRLLHRQAMEEFARGDVAAAESILRNAVLTAPDNWQTQLLLARAARRQGHVEDVHATLERAKDLDAPNSMIEREQLLLLAQAGQMERVEPFIPKLLPRDAVDANEVCAALVAGYAHNFEFRQVFKYLEAWEKDYPNDAEPHVMRGRIRKRWHAVKEAELEFRKALAICPEYLGVRELLAQVLIERNQFESASEQLELALKAKPESERLQIAWADCLLRTGRTEEAEVIFAKLAVKYPDNCDILFGLGRLALWSGNSEKAVLHLSRGRELCPDRNELRYVYAQALSQAGQTEAAAAETDYVQQARIAQGRVFDLSEKLVEEPENLDARLEIGETLLRYGDATDGIAWIRTVLQFDPANARAKEILAKHAARTE